MEYVLLGVATPLLLIGFYIVYEIIRYNPLNENTTIPQEDEEDRATNQ